jgi:hypothetical protein
LSRGGYATGQKFQNDILKYSTAFSTSAMAIASPERLEKLTWET